MNTQVRYVKSFSKGQITIPKEFRDAFGIGDDFWLKLSLKEDKLIAEPVKEEKKMSKAAWRTWLLSINETWDLRREIKKNREDMEKQMKAREL